MEPNRKRKRELVDEEQESLQRFRRVRIIRPPAVVVEPSLEQGNENRQERSVASCSHISNNG